MVVMIGSGLVQDAKPVAMKSGEKILAVLGYRIESRRAAVGGLNTVGEIVEKPVRTKAFQTDCFSTNFDRSGFEAQAVDGDSGGASFVYNQQRGRWELAGCIIAVSQADGFVPFGSQTFMANLSRYAGQLPNATGGLEPGLPEGLADVASEVPNLEEPITPQDEDLMEVRPTTIEMPESMEVTESDGMLM